MSATPPPSAPAGPPPPVLANVSLGRALGVILFISAAALGFLFWLIYFRPSGGPESPLIRALPAVNAGFNALSTIFLLAGFAQIRRRNIGAHLRCMLAAFTTSTLFLICYIAYHASHGDTRFLAQGWIRPVYFFVLGSHILLSVAALPLILTSLFLAASGRWSTHRKVSRFTFPLWLYVSVTGVLVFALLKIFNP